MTNFMSYASVIDAAELNTALISGNSEYTDSLIKTEAVPDPSLTQNVTIIINEHNVLKDFDNKILLFSMLLNSCMEIIFTIMAILLISQTNMINISKMPSIDA